MNKLSAIGSLAATGLCFWLAGCEQDVTMTGSGETVPVVFAMLNPDDSVHYMRIGRSYKSEGNALDIARLKDSISYERLVPRVELYTESGWKYHELLFEPVSEMNKEDGIFTGEGFQLYRCPVNFKSLIIKGTHLVLNVQPGLGQTLVSSVIEYVDPPKILAPKQGLLTYMNFYPAPVEVRFEDPPEFVRYELHVRLTVFNILTTGDTVVQVVDKLFTRNTENTGRPRLFSSISVNVPGDLLLTEVRQQIRSNDGVDYRMAGDFEIHLWTGSREYYDYIDLNRMADDFGGRSITNISGGAGVFGFRYLTRIDHLHLGQVTLDSLVNGRFTRNLKFKSW